MIGRINKSGGGIDINGIIEEYTVASGGETINKGDFIEIVNDRNYSVDTAIAVSTDFYYPINDIIEISPHKYCVLGANSNYSKLVIVQKEGNSYTAGTPLVTELYSNSSYHIAKINNDKIALIGKKKINDVNSVIIKVLGVNNLELVDEITTAIATAPGNSLNSSSVSRLKDNLIAVSYNVGNSYYPGGSYVMAIKYENGQLICGTALNVSEVYKIYASSENTFIALSTNYIRSYTVNVDLTITSDSNNNFNYIYFSKFATLFKKSKDTYEAIGNYDSLNGRFKIVNFLVPSINNYVNGMPGGSSVLDLDSNSYNYSSASATDLGDCYAFLYADGYIYSGYNYIGYSFSRNSVSGYGSDTATTKTYENNAITTYYDSNYNLYIREYNAGITIKKCNTQNDKFGIAQESGTAGETIKVLI